VRGSKDYGFSGAYNGVKSREKILVERKIADENDILVERET